MHRRKIFFIILIGLTLLALLDPDINVQYKRQININSDRNLVFTGPSVSRTDTFVIEEPITQFELINRMGDVSIVGEDRTDIEVEYEIKVTAQTEELAAESLEQISINQRIMGEKAIIELESPPITSSGIRHRVDADYIIKVPQNIAIEVQANHGEIELQNLHNGVNGRFKFADNTGIKNLSGEVDLLFEHSHAAIEDIKGNFYLEMFFSELNVNEITGNMKLESRHTDAIITDLGGSLNARSEHSDIEVSNIAGDVDWNINFGQLKLTELNSQVMINGRHAPIELELNPNQSGYEFDMHIRYADLDSNLDLQGRDIFDNARRYSGSYEAGENLVRVDSEFGDVTVRVR